MSLRPHPSFPCFHLETLEPRVYLSGTVTLDALLAGSALDMRDLLEVQTERGMEHVCDEDALTNNPADVMRLEAPHCKRPRGELQGVLLIEDDIAARYRSIPETHAPEPVDVPAADAIDEYLEHRDDNFLTSLEEGRKPIAAYIEQPFIPEKRSSESRSLLHDAVLDDFLADGSILASVLADRSMQSDEKEPAKPWSPLRERLRLWEQVPQKVEPEERREERKDEKKEGEVSEKPMQDDSVPMEEEGIRLKVVPKGDQPEGGSSQDAAPTGKTERSSSSILSRGLGGARSLVSRGWAGFKRLLAA